MKNYLIAALLGLSSLLFAEMDLTGMYHINATYIHPLIEEDYEIYFPKSEGRKAVVQIELSKSQFSITGDQAQYEISLEGETFPLIRGEDTYFFRDQGDGLSVEFHIFVPRADNHLSGFFLTNENREMEKMMGFTLEKIAP